MLVQGAELSVAITFLVMAATEVIGIDSWQERPGPVPIGAIALLTLVAGPTLAQGLWSSVFRALERDPGLITSHHEYWRLMTSILVQDGGVVGAAFNLATLAIVAPLGVWFWGWRRATTIFFSAGLVFNLIAVAYDQPGAGNSGATYGLVASIAGYGVIRCAARVRALCWTALGFAGFIWLLGNIHGMAAVAGGVIGAGIAVLDPESPKSTVQRAV